ncbi:hypothetical protein CKM354_000600900 [Cercospora kikuchii]|uniref:Uncharacterized protein n=1 Tax=Cercospora kikuchii TaxID=84275 RepID=A0A9P3FCW8_9PEZI|nr:uncharacterized protein CKM354_000600900 [Cercospora kikuchii]GIZ42751.1 hypothetical protein CKM354_000600900 [Cercospora kikuchii]
MQEDNFLDGPGVAPWHRNMGCPKGSIWSTEELACTSPQNQKKKRDTLAKRNFLPKPTIGHPEWWRNIPPIPVDHLKGINTINKIKKRNAEQQQQQQKRQTSDRPVVLGGWNPSLQISDETLKILFPDHNPHLNNKQKQQQLKRQTSNRPLPGTWNQNLQIPDETFQILFPNAIRAGSLQQQKEQKNRRATIVGIEQLFSKAHISPESWNRIFANSKIHSFKN